MKNKIQDKMIYGKTFNKVVQHLINIYNNILLCLDKPRIFFFKRAKVFDL